MPPLITGTSGTLGHGQTLTIEGAGFGLKTPAAPLIWDNCSHGDPVLVADGGRWSRVWPEAGGAATELNYRTPAALGRGVALPHNRVTAYLCGSHFPATNALDGVNVALMTTYTRPAFPFESFWAFYTRNDPAWVFGLGNGDNNYKNFGYSIGGSIYELPNNWYIEYNGPLFESADGVATWHINDDNGSLQNPDQNGHSWWHESADNPYQGWVYTEIRLRLTDQNDGYIQVFERNVRKMNYVGRTDAMAGTDRTEGLGGFTRNNGNENNWRYFADVYYDRSLARVAIGNAATWAASTKRAMQIPLAWTDGQITVEQNFGAFADGEDKYLYVWNAAGDGNEDAGFLLTQGGAMAQFARPSADTTLGNYTDQAGGTTNIFQAIDEAVASDADFIQSEAAPATSVYVTKLSTIEDPQTSSGHTVRYRYGKDAASGSQINLTVELRQGYVSEASLGTLIASWSHTNVSDEITQADQVLTGQQADAITDYANLFLRFIYTQV